MKRISSVTELGKALNISSATLTNWKSRGISREGAQAAEEVFGVSPSYVLKGTGLEASRQVQEPPATYMPQLGADAMVLARYFDKIRSIERRQVAFAQCVMVIDAELPEGLGAPPAGSPRTTPPTRTPAPSPQSNDE